MTSISVKRSRLTGMTLLQAAGPDCPSSGQRKADRPAPFEFSFSMHECLSDKRKRKRMPNKLWDELREMVWLVMVIGVLSAAGVGLAIALAAI
jgi:hypothetical protein